MIDLKCLEITFDEGSGNGGNDVIKSGDGSI